MSTVPVSLDVFCRGQLTAMRDEGYEVVALSSPGQALDNVYEREQVRTHSIPMERRISPLKDLKSLWRLYRYFRHERPEMVHSLTPKAGLLGMMAAKMAGVPLRIHTFTGLVWPARKGITRRILKATDRILCRCATHINPEGKGVRKDLLDGSITRKPLYILANGNVRGIDGKYFDRTPQIMTAASALMQPGTFTFLFIGRIVSEKGIDELVSAFSNLKEYNCRLIIIGPDESDIDPIKQETKQIMHNDPRIIPTGEQNDIRPWLAVADMLVLPSHREGFPNAVLEAGAMGVPAIVTDINGSREIIQHGYNGWVIPLCNDYPSRSQALHEAMRSALENKEKVHEMASASRKHILENWDKQIVLDALLQFYRNLFDGISPTSMTQ